MESIAHRDLRNHSSEVLRRVAAGEAFEVTNHGSVVAHLVPASRSAAPVGLRLVARSSSAPFLAPVTDPGGGSPQSVLDDLDALRAER